MFSVAIMILLVVFQIYIFKKNRMLFFVLPLLSFLVSISVTLCVPERYKTELGVIDENGSKKMISSEEHVIENGFISSLSVFSLTNIPTVVFISPYFFLKKKKS